MTSFPPYRRLVFVSGFVLFVLVIVGAAVAAPGFDRAFGEGGVVETPMPEADKQIISESSIGPIIWDLAAGRGGEMVGAIGSGTSTPFFGAVSYWEGGSLNRRLGGDGFVEAKEVSPDFPSGFSGNSQARSVATQPNGRVVVIGYQGDRGEPTAPVLMRFLSNGKPDPSFGQRGLVAPQPRRHNGEVLHGVAIQRDGRIIAVGARNENRGGRPAALVIAYRPDGRIDRRFGDGGRVLFVNRRIGYNHTGLRSISLLSNGKILVVGYRNDHLFVARLRASGRLDRSFGRGDGKVSIDLGIEGCCPSAASLSVLRNGDTIILGNAPKRLAMVRLRPDGRLNRSFGRRGIVDSGAARRLEYPYDVAVQGDGRIVAVGIDFRRITNERYRRVFTILRYRPDGKLDRTFGNGGIASLPIGYNSIATSALTLPSGRVVVGGGEQIRSGDDFEYSLLLARLR